MYRYKVIAVDDEIPILELFQTYRWEEQQCDLVGVFRNGEEAFAFCGERKVDIIITDITMPVMDGVELLKKTSVDYPTTKTILLSCHQDFIYAKKALEYGAVDYILKIELSESKVFKVLDKAKRYVNMEHHVKNSDSMKVKNTVQDVDVIRKADVCSASGRKSDQSTQEYDKKRYEVRKAVKIIEKEYMENLSLHEIAYRVNLSPQYFSKVFSEEIGMSITDYLCEIRMAKAFELIRESNYKIYQIAEMVGIPSYRYFIAVFKKKYGKSPKILAGRYRKKEGDPS